MALAERPQLPVQDDDALLSALETAVEQDPDALQVDLLEAIADLRERGELGDAEADALLRHVVAAMTVTDVTRLIEDAFSARAIRDMTRSLRFG